jgi:feruloyl esterase
MKSIRVALAAAMALAPMGAPLVSMAQPARSLPACDASSFKPADDVTLTAVKAVTGPVNYCRIDGYVTTTNPGPNHVRFQVSLPEHWAGRFLFTVQGGAAGFLPDPDAGRLGQGFAVASTDKGTRAAHILDFTFRKDPAQSLDWGHRGVHVAALATQALTRQYYGQEKLYRYVTGCSGGGDGTLTEAEKHPTDFDAFVPGAMTYDVYIGVMWGAVAQREFRNPNSWISPEEMKRVGEVIMKEFDASDGAVDGLIWEPWKIKLDRASFTFLNDDQYGTLELLANGLPQVGPISYPGFFLSNPSALSATVLGSTRPPWGQGQGPRLFTVTDTAARGDRGPNYNVLTDFHYDSPADMAQEEALTKASGRTYFDPAHLTGLRDSGAKMIMWSGAADNAVPPRNLVNYTTDATKDYGPGRTTWFRSFLAPGMFHCQGGEGAPTNVPDRMVDAAVDWVEHGKAPDSVVVSNPTNVSMALLGAAASNAPEGQATRTYRLCPYPQRSVFKGGVANPAKLDVNDAGNWTCKP